MGFEILMTKVPENKHTVKLSLTKMIHMAKTLITETNVCELLKPFTFSSDSFFRTMGALSNTPVHRYPRTFLPVKKV